MPDNGSPQWLDLSSLPAFPSVGSSDIAIAAKSDLEAISLWLEAKANRSQHTFDSYRREALRLLIWLHVNGMQLNQLRVEDVHAFFALLSDPPLSWLRPRKVAAGQRLAPTQVLIGPLSERSLSHTRTILGQLLAYLQDAGYVQRNAFRLSMKPAVITETSQDRLLDLDSWHWLQGWLNRMPSETRLEAAHALRCRWIFAALYHTGLRREEIAQARMGDFVRRERNWSLRVIGKGKKKRYVTVNSIFLTELVCYRQGMGMPDYPSPREEAPLVASVQAGRIAKPLNARTIGLIIHQVGKQAAADCSDAHIHAQIERVTTHWLRHTNATHRLMAGASLETTQDELGHSDPRTTRIYAKSASRHRLEDAEKLAALTTTSRSRGE